MEVQVFLVVGSQLDCSIRYIMLLFLFFMYGRNQTYDVTVSKMMMLVILSSAKIV